ncbi:MAG: lipoprotein [Thiotrichaceae bacterium]|nr:lipoprotein [Thiotrichaceae bacterium]
MLSAKFQLFFIILILSMLSSLTGCGNKGNLYLPDTHDKPVKTTNTPSQ